MRRFTQIPIVALVVALAIGDARPALAGDTGLDRVIIDPNFPDVRQVEVADINGDGRLDVVAIGGGTCAWYENPTWKKRVVTRPGQTPGIVSTATADMDGDGKAEIAIAYASDPNEPTKGKLLLACQGKGLDDAWEVAHVADVAAIHRLRWFNQAILVTPTSVKFHVVTPDRIRLAQGEKVMISELLVASFPGPTSKPTAADRGQAWPRSFHFRPGRGPSRSGGGFAGGGSTGGAGNFGGGSTAHSLDPDSTESMFGGRWHHLGPQVSRPSNDMALRAIEVDDVDGDGNPDVLACNELGVSRRYVWAVAGGPIYKSDILVPGSQGEGHDKGVSQAHSGRLKDGRRFLATLEPARGTEVAVYWAESLKPKLQYGPRTVIDSGPGPKQALWVGDIDGDGNDEILTRTGGAGLARFDFDGKVWARTVVDPTMAAQDLRGGDLDGDGLIDVVAVGGTTDDVVWYRSRKDAKTR